jgi:4-hydroxymandelate oxidase
MQERPMDIKTTSNLPGIHRKQFLKWIGLSSLYAAMPLSGFSRETSALSESAAFDPETINNVFDLENRARLVLGTDAMDYLNGGADDLRTVEVNSGAFQKIQIRARRLIDVRNIDTKIDLFGETLDYPVLLSPVGFQQLFHPLGEIATAKAAGALNFKMIISSVSNHSVTEIVRQSGISPWFQLYPSPDRNVTKNLLEQAEAAGCTVCALTVDTPVVGNRENSGPNLLKLIESGEMRMGNFDGILPKGMSFTDPGMTWDMIAWLKANSSMKIVLKGIVTREDAALAKEYGADGIIVSNHGGRQLESNRATIDCLPEIVEEINGEMPVLIDGGIRRGTDIFKALAMGAQAVCIGRPYCWGLGAFGQPGVELALEILKSELIRNMQLAGTVSIPGISSSFIERP